MTNLNSTQIHDMRAEERAAVRAAAGDAAGYPEPPRRGFFRKLLAMVIGGIVVAVPAAAGLMVFLDPVRRARKKGAAADFVPVAPLDAVPADGRPAKFQVIADRSDAWNRYKNVPLGAVYVKRIDPTTQPPRVVAWNVVCPHAGCFVDVAADGRSFRCPCHNSGFAPDGSLLPGSVSPRPMDELKVDEEALRQGIVKVQFENFLAGTAEKRAST
jgi:Rieske Fe-S protein